MADLVSQDIWTVRNFLSQEECDGLIAQAEAKGFEPATINAQGRSRRDEDVRNNDRVILDDVALAASLWTRAREHVPPFLAGRQAVGLNERFRFYRYAAGQQFKGHIDGSFLRPTGEQSLLTFMIYLNDGYRGGETAFQSVVVAPSCGLALIFAHALFHEGRAIVEGHKYVLRTDVMFNPVGKVTG